MSPYPTPMLEFRSHEGNQGRTSPVLLTVVSLVPRRVPSTRYGLNKSSLIE